MSRPIKYRDHFDEERANMAIADSHSTVYRKFAEPPYRMRNGDRIVDEWCIVHVQASYGHRFALQWIKGHKLMVRAGCRYMTLPQAWAHIKKWRRVNPNKYAQAECIIRLLLLRAQALRDLPGVKGVKFGR